MGGVTTAYVRGLRRPAADDWPEYALRRDADGTLRLYDDALVHTLCRRDDGRLIHIGFTVHDAGVCPVVRYAPDLDLEGRATGQVEPYIGLARRINKTAYDRLLVQHFNSWKIRTVAGMSEPDGGAEEAAAAKLRLRQDDIMIAEDHETKFGTLDETPLEGFIRAWESDIETLAAVSQTPSYALTGKLVNLSADALASARAAVSQKVFEITTSFGESHAQLLRLAASLEGDPDTAADVSAHVTWQDMEVRSLAQAVDALGKAATMLGVPVRALWPRMPGVTKTDVEEWSQMVLTDDPTDLWLREHYGQQGGKSADAGM